MQCVLVLVKLKFAFGPRDSHKDLDAHSCALVICDAVADCNALRHHDGNAVAFCRRVDNVVRVALSASIRTAHAVQCEHGNAHVVCAAITLTGADADVYRKQDADCQSDGFTDGDQVTYGYQVGA